MPKPRKDPSNKASVDLKTTRVKPQRAAKPHSERLWSSAQLKIADAIREVPKGAVASYGEVARRADIARGARQVVWVLKHAPEEWQLPWHRILRSDGKIAFEENSAAWKKQLRLLRAEGVAVKNGRVRVASTKANQNASTHDLDQAIWG